MATITIRDIDDALVEKIRDLAEEHNHSIEKEIRDLLQQAVTRRHEAHDNDRGHGLLTQLGELDKEVTKELMRIANDKLELSELKGRKQQLKDKIAKLQVRDRSLIDIANAIAALTPKGVPQTDSAILLREDRDR